MTKEEVEVISKLPNMAKAVLIGSVDDRENYYPAITGYDQEKGRFIYDYDLLVECFAGEFRKSHGSNNAVYEGDEDCIIEATEWVDFNVGRSLPYYGEHAPVLETSAEDDEDSED